MLAISKIILWASILLPVQAAFADSWNMANNPANLRADYEYRFSELPLNGALSSDKTPWSESYWPAIRGNAAFRWQTNQGVNDYYTYSKGDLMRMSPQQIAQLSPAEKYDIYMGRYDYPTVAQGRGASNTRLTWQGICHGWSPAALNHPEPKPVSVKNADGIEIWFGASDVKGLLSTYYAYSSDEQTKFVGTVCRRRWNCDREDVNPGAFHIVVANQLGRMNEGFILDQTQGPQIWNQPVFSFSSQVLSYNGSYVRIRTSITWASDGLFEDNISRWEPVVGTSEFKTETKIFEYTLELNSYGQITGGSWDGRESIDFIWTKPKVAAFDGYFTGLNNIYIPNQR